MTSKPIFQDVVEWYNASCHPESQLFKFYNLDRNLNSKAMQSVINLFQADYTREEIVRAYNLIIDEGSGHLWYLNVSAIKCRNTAIKIILQHKLYDHDFKGQTFEQIYIYVKSLFVDINGLRIKNLGQLAFYDITMHIVLSKSLNVWPEKVYYHATPGVAAKYILDKCYPPKKHKKEGIVSVTMFETYFGKIPAHYIESILCDMQKSKKRYYEDRQITEGIFSDLDKIVQTLIKAGLF